MQDTERFSEGMLVLGEAFGIEISNLKLKAYAQALSDFSDEQVEFAMVQALKSCRFFPKPVELMELIEGKKQDHAELAWGKLLDAMGRIGRYQSVLFEDPKIAKVVQLMGAWQKICESEEKVLQFVRKDFVSIYASLPGGGAPEVLDGICAINASAGGFLGRIPEPVRIGCEYLPPGKTMIGDNGSTKCLAPE